MVLFKGSPPRVRGTAAASEWARSGKRITPACAGNSDHPHMLQVSPQDHPRVCGEQFAAAAGMTAQEGSPPRVRGTVRCLFQQEPFHRITPACAGNSGAWRPRQHPQQDHPRVCGEQTKKSPSFLHSFLSDQENSFSLKYNCSISSQSFCARWTSLQGSSKCFAKVDS